MQSAFGSLRHAAESGLVNGAESLVNAALKGGVSLCFANAGTTELPLLLALDAAPGIRPVLCLDEGVCTGAADGYGRMLERPAMVLLHLGPGLANGISNLHNARRARSPVLNIIGQHATWHLEADPPLTMDIEALARTVSAWCRTSAPGESIASDVSEAISASLRGQIATLIVPSDCQTAQVPPTETSILRSAPQSVDQQRVEQAARLLRRSGRAALLLGGQGLREKGLQAAARIQAATGCALLAGTFPGYVERGLALPDAVRIPYFPEPALDLLSRYDAFVLAGARAPVTFFGYEGIPGHLISPGQERLEMTEGDQDAADALEALADVLGAPSWHDVARRVDAGRESLAVPEGDLTPESACQTIAALQPEGAIILDEGLTAATTYYPLTAASPPHTFLTVTGGSIGYGMPCAVGAALACPDRPVINVQADGSAMYTVQALWTQARESLNVTTLIASNRSYNILKLELDRAGITSPGPNTRSIIDLGRPDIEWPNLARGMGVPGVTVTTAEGLARELQRSLAEPGPHLIEMVLAARTRP